MSAEKKPYFKFIVDIIRCGLWAELSSAARTLYPVLLTFSDGNFKPVYPGTKVLRKLTGFKHKGSLSKARKELVEKGLITLSAGSGRENTYYQFCFNFMKQGEHFGSPQGVSAIAPWGLPKPPAEGGEGRGEGYEKTAPLYNQIHISIDNNQLEEKANANSIQGKEKWDFLKRRFGSEAVQLASSECGLGGIAPNITNVEKILYRKGKTQRNHLSERNKWSEMKRELSNHISPGSLDIICRAYQSDKDGIYIFRDTLPEHLKNLLQRVCRRVFFEPAAETKIKKQRLLR